MSGSSPARRQQREVPERGTPLRSQVRATSPTLEFISNPVAARKAGRRRRGYSKSPVIRPGDHDCSARASRCPGDRRGSGCQERGRIGPACCRSGPSEFGPPGLRPHPKPGALSGAGAGARRHSVPIPRARVVPSARNPRPRDTFPVVVRRQVLCERSGVPLARDDRLGFLNRAQSFPGEPRVSVPNAASDIGKGGPKPPLPGVRSEERLPTC